MARRNNGSAGSSNTKKLGLLSLVTIAGEGYDEWKQRYFKLKVKGSAVNLPPYSMRRINTDPEALYTDLSNAGANVFTADTKQQLLKLLENQKAERPAFKVASYPGWHGSRLVFPDKSQLPGLELEARQLPQSHHAPHWLLLRVPLPEKPGRGRT